MSALTITFVLLLVSFAVTVATALPLAGALMDRPGGDER